jgi:hypothetical protein
MSCILPNLRLLWGAATLGLLLSLAACSTDTDKNTLDPPNLTPVDNTLPILEVSNVPPNYAQVASGTRIVPAVRGFSSPATTGLDGNPIKLKSLVIQVAYNSDAPITVYRNDEIDTSPTPTVFTMPPDTFRILDRPGIETWRYLLSDLTGRQRVVQFQYEVIQDTLSPRLNFLDGTTNNNTNVVAGGSLRFNIEALKSINGAPLQNFTLEVSYGNSPYIPLIIMDGINPVRYTLDTTMTVARQVGTSRWRFRVRDAEGRTDTKIRTHYIL